MLCLTTITPFTAGAMDASGCDVRTYEALVLSDKVYVATIAVGTRALGAEIFMETNGIDGLQKGATWCSDGTVVPADSCVTRIGGVSTSCVTQLAFTTIP